jgi:hypothetical protein
MVYIINIPSISDQVTLKQIIWWHSVKSFTSVHIHKSSNSISYDSNNGKHMQCQQINEPEPLKLGRAFSFLTRSFPSYTGVSVYPTLGSQFPLYFKTCLLQNLHFLKNQHEPVFVWITLYLSSSKHLFYIWVITDENARKHINISSATVVSSINKTTWTYC